MLSLSRTIPALVLFYVAGAVWAASDGLASLGDAILNGTVLNAPLVIVAAQALGSLAALRASGGRARAGAALVLLACTVSLAAVAFDGDLGHAGLTGLQVGWQVVIAVFTALTWIAAVGRLVALRGSRPPHEHPCATAAAEPTSLPSSP